MQASAAVMDHFLNGMLLVTRLHPCTSRRQHELMPSKLRRAGLDLVV